MQEFQPWFRRAWLPLTAALVVTSLATFSAHEPQGQRRFFAGVELVAVDFAVVDADGRPVTDLRQDEVTVRVDGRSRVVRSLQYVDVARPPGLSAPAAPLPPPFGTNSLADAGRVFVMVIDDESFRPGKEGPMRAAAGQFLASLSDHDRVALVTVPHGGTKSDLTTDHDRIEAAIQNVTGQAPQQLDASVEACRTRRTLESLDGLLRGIVNPDGPTNVLFFSSSMLPPRRDAIATRAPGACEITREHFLFVGQSAGAARAQFFVVMPTEVMPDPAYEVANFAATEGSANPMEGLEHLAGVTGGHRLTLATTQDRPLDRVLRETSGYYIVAFEPESSDRNGENHGLDVNVNRPGVTRRSRPFVSIARTQADQPVPTITPADMLREARVYRDLPLRTTGYNSRGSSVGEIQVLVFGEGIEPSAALVAAAAGLFDMQGRLVAQWTATPEMLGRRSVIGALSAPPGNYRLRFAARDSEGRTGTADSQIDVGLARADGFALSSVVLGLSRAATASTTASFQPRLEFTTEPVAIAYVDIYGGQAGDRVGAQVELATSVDGPAMFTLPLALEPTSESNRFQAMGAVPIGGLPDGDYLLRIAVGAEGMAATRVVRTLRKSAG